MARDGISKKMADKILESQMPIDEKIKYGDFIIENEGSIDDAFRKVDKVWKSLKQIQKDINNRLLNS